jgi:indolepyruvate ferredoxin oxidoreductase beta subunit
VRGVRGGSLRDLGELWLIEAWLERARTVARRDVSLAVEILEARRLVKGYSDTHDAGQGKFSRLMAMADRLDGRADAAEWMRRLRTAALADAEGRALDDTIKTIESFL